MNKILRLIAAVIGFLLLNVQAEEPKEYTFAINSAVTPLLHAAFVNQKNKPEFDPGMYVNTYLISKY